MIRAKPAGFLTARSLGSLNARMTARWVLGSQDPGFPAEEVSKVKVKRLMMTGVKLVGLTMCA